MQSSGVESWILREHEEDLLKIKEEYLALKGGEYYENETINPIIKYSAQKPRHSSAMRNYISPRVETMSHTLYQDLEMVKQKEGARKFLNKKRSHIAHESILKTHMENLMIVNSIESQLNNYII